MPNVNKKGHFPKSGTKIGRTVLFAKILIFSTRGEKLAKTRVSSLNNSNLPICKQ